MGYVRCFVVAVAMLASVSAFAWLDGDSFYPRLAQEDWLTAKDKETLLDDMSCNADILVIDGVEYLAAYSPLELIRGKRRYYEMYDGLLMPRKELKPSAFWGNRANRCERAWECNLEVRGDSLYLTEIYHLTAPEHEAEYAVRDCGDVYAKATSHDSIGMRMEVFTDCRFVDGRMFLPIVSGTVFVKKTNLAPRPDVWNVADKDAEDMRVFLHWQEEPVYRVVFDEGVMISMESMDEPITAEDYRALVRRTAFLAVIAVLLVVAVFVLRDYYRKRKYLRMYEALQKNQTQLVIAIEQSEEGIDRYSLSREEVIGLYRENFTICRERFRLLGWPQRLEKMSASIHADQLMLGVDERQRLSKDLDECFIQVNVNLRSEGRLTNDDVRCCLLAMLGCPLNVVGLCLGCSTEAVQTRKSRLKDKLPRDVFEWVFMKN